MFEKGLVVMAKNNLTLRQPNDEMKRKVKFNIYNYLGKCNRRQKHIKTDNYLSSHNQI